MKLALSPVAQYEAGFPPVAQDVVPVAVAQDVVHAAAAQDVVPAAAP